MTPDTQNLSPAQKELVAVGASIGAGCHPCVSHHLKAGAQAGLDSAQLLAAVAGAESVASDAAVLVADHARSKLEQTAATTLTPLDDALAALGAALGANDAAAIDLQLRAALDFGASKPQLREAIAAAQNVQENAGRIHVRKAEQLLDSLESSSTIDTAALPDGGCRCGAADESGDAKDDRKAGFGFGFDPAAMMAHCREMLRGAFGSSAAPAEQKGTSTATAAPNGCSGTKEVYR